MEEDEKEREEEDMEVPGPAEDNETSLLDPGSEEEDDEDEEDVEENMEEELLKEEEEVSTEEVDKVETEEEKRSGEEVTTFLNVKDHSDPLNVNQDPNFSNLAITSPKGTPVSDDDVTTVNENCQAKANDSLVTKSATGSNNLDTKSNPGSIKSHQAESFIKEPASKTAEVYMQEKEKKEEKGEEEDDELSEEQEKEDEEVQITKEVKGGSREEEKEEKKEEAAKKGSSPGAGLMAARDTRYKEVKAEI